MIGYATVECIGLCSSDCVTVSNYWSHFCRTSGNIRADCPGSRIDSWDVAWIGFSAIAKQRDKKSSVHAVAVWPKRCETSLQLVHWRIGRTRKTCCPVKINAVVLRSVVIYSSYLSCLLNILCDFFGDFQSLWLSLHSRYLYMSAHR